MNDNFLELQSVEATNDDKAVEETDSWCACSEWEHCYTTEGGWSQTFSVVSLVNSSWLLPVVQFFYYISRCWILITRDVVATTVLVGGDPMEVPQRKKRD